MTCFGNPLTLKTNNAMPRILIILLGLGGLSISCSTPDYLPTPAETTSFVHGSRLIVRISEDKTIRGELIEVNPNTLMLMENRQDTRVRTVPKDRIEWIYIMVALTYNERKTVESLTTLNSILPLGHGLFGIATLPINWAVSANRRNNFYRIRYPEGIAWDELHRFARFPQGLPPNVDPLQIR